jgi:hypothetical protein
MFVFNEKPQLDDVESFSHRNMSIALVNFARKHSLKLTATWKHMQTSMILNLTPALLSMLFFSARPEHGEELHVLLHPPPSDVMPGPFRAPCLGS